MHRVCKHPGLYPAAPVKIRDACGITQLLTSFTTPTSVILREVTSH